MMKKMFCWVLLLSGLLILPVEARSLFLQTAEQAATTMAPKTNVSDAYPLQSYRLKFANAKELGATLKGLLAKGEGLAVNEKLNTLVVRASEKTIKRLTKLIGFVDTPPLQVQVEAKIIELKSGDGDTTNPSSLGTSWKAESATSSDDYIQFNSTDVATAAAGSLGLYAQLLTGDINLYLSALQKTTGYDLVAAPWITALNHEEAEILIGSKYGYKTTLTTTTGTMQNIEFLEVGTKLKFTPHINEQGYIIMDIYPSISEGQIVNELPRENTTETKNKVLVKDGQSIVVGGLTKNYTNEIEIGVPLLASIPLIGNLFRRKEITSEKREIMVVITPHIVTPEFLATMAERAKELDERRKAWSEKVRLVP